MSLPGSLCFLVAVTSFRCWAWCTPGARFLASGMDATEKTGGVNVKTCAIFLKNRRTATGTGPARNQNGTGRGPGWFRDGAGGVGEVGA